MTITDGYCTADEFKASLGVSDTLDQGLIEDSITEASQWVRDLCGRTFTKSTSATAKLYTPPAAPDGLLPVDDFWETASLVVADRSATLTINTQFQVEPQGVIGAQANYPYTGLRPLSWYWLEPNYPGQYTITVTAKWGWISVPAPVKRATIMKAADLYRSKDNRFGVAGFGDFGAVRVRGNQMIEDLLAPYKRADSAPGFGLA